MDEQLKAKFIAYLEKIELAAGKAAEFAEVEIPETIREYLRWIAIENATYAAMSFVPFIAWLCTAKLWSKWRLWATTAEATAMYYLARLSTLALSLAVIATFGSTNGLRAVKVIAAPRVIIVEEVSKFVGVRR